MNRSPFRSFGGVVLADLSESADEARLVPLTFHLVTDPLGGGIDPDAELPAPAAEAAATGAAATATAAATCPLSPGRPWGGCDIANPWASRGDTKNT